MAFLVLLRDDGTPRSAFPTFHVSQKLASTLHASSPPHRFGRRRPLQWGVALVVLLVICVRYWNESQQEAPPEVAAPEATEKEISDGREPTPNSKTPKVSRPKALKAGEHKVFRTVDGDTLVLFGGARVRLIGVDTAEFTRRGNLGRFVGAEPWAVEGYAFTKQFVAGGRVRLEFDGDRTDKHDRFLAYVWVGDKMLNEELLRAGLAKHTPHFDYSAAMKRRFATAQQEAQQHHRGRWSSN